MDRKKCALTLIGFLCFFAFSYAGMVFSHTSHMDDHGMDDVACLDLCIKQIASIDTTPSLMFFVSSSFVVIVSVLIFAPLFPICFHLFEWIGLLFRKKQIQTIILLS